MVSFNYLLKQFRSQVDRTLYKSTLTKNKFYIKSEGTVINTNYIVQKLVKFKLFSCGHTKNLFVDYKEIVYHILKRYFQLLNLEQNNIGRK